MKVTMCRLVVLCLATTIGAGCQGGSGASGDTTAAELVGAWSGTMSHGGEEEPFALELEATGDATLQLRLTIPAMNLSRLPAGEVEPRIEGRQVTLGPFVFTHDPEADTLSGTIPASMAPVHEIPVTLRRVEAVEEHTRPQPAAPLAAPVWSFEAGSPLWPGTTFAGGIVYAGDDAGVLHALDASTGRERWAFATEGPIRTRATVEGGAVFFQSDDGVLYRLDAETGAVVWRVRLMEGPVERRPPGDPESRYDCFGSDVTVAEGRVFVGTHDGRVLALDPATGATRWEFSTDGSVLAAPAVSGGRVFAGAFGGQVYALDATTGEAVWSTDTKGAVLSTPAVAGDLVVVGNRTYDVVALRADTGEIAWTQYIWFSWVESSATVRDGVLYLGSSDAAAAFAFHAASGKRLWETDVFGWSWGQPAVTEERVYVQTAGMRGYQNDNHRGGVMALDRTTGEPAWRYAVEPPEEGPWGFPGSAAVGEGRVYVGGLDGRVLTFAQ